MTGFGQLPDDVIELCMGDSIRLSTRLAMTNKEIKEVLVRLAKARGGLRLLTCSPFLAMRAEKAGLFNVRALSISGHCAVGFGQDLAWLGALLTTCRHLATITVGPEYKYLVEDQESQLKWLHVHPWRMSDDKLPTRHVKVWVRGLGGLNYNVPSACQISSPTYAFDIIVAHGMGYKDPALPSCYNWLDI